MSRHRGIRNRAYSWEDDEYDEEYYDDEPNSPNSNEFMYRRDSPSHNRSVFTFVEETSKNETESAGDTEILGVLAPQVKEAVGNKFTDEQIFNELRESNYDLDKTVISLFEKARTATATTSFGKLPTEIHIPCLDVVALSISDSTRNAKSKSTVIASIGGKVSDKTSAKKEKKRPKENEDGEGANEAKKTTGIIPIARAISSHSLYSDVEKKAFEKAEAKTQEEYLKLQEVEVKGNAKQRISMVVIGHVDAGKSTITGHLLYQLGYVSQRMMHKFEKESRDAGKSSFAYAWVMDADEEERKRGVTMDVGTSYFETATKHVTLLDAPGHRDFIPKMISGASQADVAVLVVPASTGEFEAAFEHSGQTKEHTLLVRSLGVTQMIVAVNKMDSVAWSKKRFDAIVVSLTNFLQKSGFRLQNLWFIPLSGMTGANLQSKVDAKECDWYTGPTLIEAIDQFSPPIRHINKPFRMCVSDVSKSLSLGQTISGRIYAGATTAGDTFLLMPVGLPLTIKGIEQDGKQARYASAGDNVELGVTGIDPSALSIGSMLCSIASPIKVARKFEAKIMTMPVLEVPIVKGTSMTIHMHNIDEPVNISRLVSVLNQTGEIEKKKPRCITREKSAVVQITCPRSICIELFSDYRQLGRFTLRDRGTTLAAGIITEILD